MRAYSLWKLPKAGPVFEQELTESLCSFSAGGWFPVCQVGEHLLMYREAEPVMTQDRARAKREKA